MTETNSTAENQIPQPWYAVRTFNCQELKVSRFLTDNQLVHFIPMTLVKKVTVNEDGQETVKSIHVPAVHNLLFVQKKGTTREMMKVLGECLTPMSIFRQPGDTKPCEISDRDMVELRMLCDLQYENSVFMSQGEAEAMVGKEVRVIAGPFKGAIGKLVRKHKQFYFLKAVIGVGVMVRVSRWYCEPI